VDGASANLGHDLLRWIFIGWARMDIANLLLYCNCTNYFPTLHGEVRTLEDSLMIRSFFLVHNMAQEWGEVVD
jgi:hypothetical protein